MNAYAESWQLTVGARLHVVLATVFNVWVGLAYLFTPGRYHSLMFVQAKQFLPMQAWGAIHVVLGLAILVFYMLGHRHVLFWVLMATSAYAFFWMGLSMQTLGTNFNSPAVGLTLSAGALYFYPAVSMAGLSFVLLPSRRTRRIVKRAEAIVREAG